VLEIPDVVVEKAIEGGANGEVFLGVDTLRRKVAIKLWKTYTNPRGFERAWEEVHKLATLMEYGTLFAHVYRFGNFPVPEQPEQRIAYAILEYVDGVSGKAWLKSSPDSKARYAVWKLVRTALSIIYREGMLHGDPHLGNVIIFEDAKGHYKAYVPPAVYDTLWGLVPPLGVKLIDFGSSLLWDNHINFVEKECNIIAENFGKLFPDIGETGPDKRAIGSNPGLTLDAFDVWLEYSRIVQPAIKNPWLARRDERSYDDLSRLQQQIQGLLFDRPLVSVSVLAKHMQQLGYDYTTLLGKKFESIQDEQIKVRQSGLI
jgi:serine/threonine protein kinase